MVGQSKKNNGYKVSFSVMDKMVGYTSKKKWQNETRIFSAQFFGLASQAMAELSKRYSLTTHSLRATTGREKVGGTNTNGLNLGARRA